MFKLMGQGSKMDERKVKSRTVIGVHNPTVLLFFYFEFDQIILEFQSHFYRPFLITLTDSTVKT